MPADTAIPEVLREGREGPQEAPSGTRSMEIAPPPEKSPPDAPPDASLTLLAQYQDIQGKLAERYGPQIVGAEQAIRGAERKASDVAERVVKPGIEGVRAAASVPVPPLPQMAPEPPVPSQQARPFLAGTKDPLMSVINGLGLLAQLAMAGTAPVAALGALTGAMNGWAKGDQERAEKDWREYLQVVDRVRHENRQSLQVWEAAMQASGANQAQAQARFAADMAELGLADRGVATAGQDMTRTLGMLTMERSLVDGLFGKTIDVMKWQAANRVAEETRKQTAEFTRERLEETKRHNLETELQREREMVQRAKESDQRFQEKVREFDKKFDGAFSAASDPASIDMAANLLLERGSMPQLGAGMAGARTAILRRAAEITAERGQTPQDVIARQQLNRAVQGALTTNMRQTAQLGNFIKTAEKIKDQGLTISEEVDRTGVPLFNKWLQAGQRAIAGDPGITKFDLANASLALEFARVMNSATGGGVSTVDARRHALELLNTAQTKEQYRAAVGQIHQELMARVQSLREESEELQNLTRGKGTLTAPTGTHRPSGDTKASSGETTMRVRRKTDGKTGTLQLSPGERMPPEYEAVK